MGTDLRVAHEAFEVSFGCPGGLVPQQRLDDVERHVLRPQYRRRKVAYGMAAKGFDFGFLAKGLRETSIIRVGLIFEASFWLNEHPFVDSLSPMLKKHGDKIVYHGYPVVFHGAIKAFAGSNADALASEIDV